MKQNVNKLIKNSIAIFLSRLLPIMFSFFFVVYIARFIGVTGFGKFALALGYYQLFLALTSTGLRIITTREIGKLPSEAPQYLSISLMLGFMVTIVAICLLIAFSYIIPYAEDTKVALYLVSIALLPGTIAMVFEAGFIGFEKAEYVTYGTVLENCMRTGLWFIALLLGYKLKALFIILIITRSLMSAFYILCYSQKISKFDFRIQLKLFNQFFTEWKIIASETWLSSLIYNLDFIFLSIFCGERIVGLYMAAYKIINFADIAVSSYTVAIFPYISRLYKKSEIEFSKLIEKSQKYILIILLPCSIILATISDKIILFLYAKEYVNSIPIFSVLIWVMSFKFLNPFLSHALFARGEQKKSLQVAAISLIFYIPISIYFILQWQAIGAALALVIISAFSFCLFSVFLWKSYGLYKIIIKFKGAIITFICFGISVFFMQHAPFFLYLFFSIILYFILINIFNVFSQNEMQDFHTFFQKSSNKVSKKI